jgi:tetratricopeptide (TPR) repeat protein
MSDRIRGIHPRLVPRAPDPRPSLAVLPALRDVGDDFAWAVWYAVWRVRDGEEPAGPAAAAERLDRFESALGCVPELDEALRTLSAYLRGDEMRKPAANALLRISDWALDRGAAEPAIQCAEAAAALVPESSRLALAAGKANRIFSEAARAAIHYERAMTMARLARKWRMYVRAHVGLGQVKKALGAPAAARAHYYTAARAARSLSGEKWLAAQTRHDLLVLAAEEGVFEEALRHARHALEWYPRHHSRLPALVHDFGFLLMRLHLYGPAVPLLTMVMRVSIPSQDQVIGWSTLARAAAGIGDEQAYHRAVEEVLRRVGLFDLHAAAAFENLAWGAHLLTLWDLAEQYASRSIEISLGKDQHESLENARRVLRAARAKSVLDHETPEGERLGGQVRELARDMSARLAAWRGPTWKRKRQYGPERWKSSEV